MMDNEIPISISERQINKSYYNSLQKRNTKNLSLSINMPHMGSPQATIGLKDNTISAQDININNIDNISINSGDGNASIDKNNSNVEVNRPLSPLFKIPPHLDISPLLTRRSEAAIYSFSSNSKRSSLSPIHTTFEDIGISSSTQSETPSTRNHIPLRYRSKTISTIETSSPLNSISKNPKLSVNTDTNKLVKTSNTMHIPTIASTYIPPDATGRKEKTTWVFPKAHSRISNIQNNETDNSTIYPEVYKQDVYPDGPLLVIPPNIYLYSEPRLEEILNFDLIINVAEEIPNLQNLIPETFHGKIEYYHIEWSHRSKIVKDLRRLTDIMHNASIRNKKVLIHCQCGVSRSASLIVAYVMRFCNMNLNEAYQKVKSIAKDISPNMGLIFQLMEWNEELSKFQKGIIADPVSDSNCNMTVDTPGISSNDTTLNTSSDISPNTPL